MQNSAPKDRKSPQGKWLGEAAKGQSIAVQHTDYMADMTDSEEDEDSEVESFRMEHELDDDSIYEAPKYLLSAEGDDGPDLQNVDPETQARLEALLEAAGIGKLSTPDGKHFADPEVLRKLTSSVSCALDEAAAALSRMRAESAGQLGQAEATLAEACSDGDAGAVKKLLEEGRNVNEATEEGDSLLSLACQAGYYELAQVLLAMRANVEDRGIKGDCTPLMEAASAGHSDIVKLLIGHNADVNAQSTSGNTALMYACASGHLEVVKSLLAANANVEDHNENGHTPLMEAASAGHVVVAKLLLDHGAGVNTHSNEFKESALTLACYKGHLEMVRFLLDAGADQEHKTDEMHTALMEASMDGHVEVARLLLDSGAQVNMPADSFESPLTLAACGGHVELAMLLLERGANIEEVNDEGYTPLMEAAREGHEEMVALLLSQGADINAQTEETQETALTLSCCGGFLEVSDFLIKAGADIEMGASTPLMEAAQEGRLELVKYLLNARSNVHACTQTGDTALTYACENGHTDVADLLLQSSADLEHESEGGRTPLMKAARAGHVCTVQFLISRGADVNRHTTNNDHTALSLACAGGHLVVVELLIASGADPTHKLKDNSTMLIEASKGGHTAIVQMLLDYPNNMAAAAAAAAAAANTSSQSDATPVTTPTFELPEAHRVPPHGLPHLIPLDLNPGVTHTYYHNLQSGAAGVVTPKQETAKRSQPLPSALPPQQSLPEPQQQLQASRLTETLTTAELQQVKNAPAPSHLAPGFPPDFNYDFQGALEAGSHVVDVAEEVTLELDRDVRPCQRLEACINNMMKKAELLHHNREEQIMQKQQILEELQRVERELQDKAQAQLLLNSQQQVAAVAHHHHHHHPHPPEGCPLAAVPLPPTSPVAGPPAGTANVNGSMLEYAQGMAAGFDVVRRFKKEITAAATAKSVTSGIGSSAGSTASGLPYFLVEGPLVERSLQPLPSPSSSDLTPTSPAPSLSPISSDKPKAKPVAVAKRDQKAAAGDAARLQHFKMQLQHKQQQLQLVEELEKLNVPTSDPRSDLLPPVGEAAVAAGDPGAAQQQHQHHHHHHHVQTQDSAVVSVGLHHHHHLCPSQMAPLTTVAATSPPTSVDPVTVASLAAVVDDTPSQDPVLKSITQIKNHLNTVATPLVGNIPLNTADTLTQLPGSQQVVLSPQQQHCVPTSTVATQYIDPSLPVTAPLPAWSTAPAAMATLQQVTAAQAAAVAAAAEAKRKQADVTSGIETSGDGKDAADDKEAAGPVMPPPLIDVNSQTDSNHDTALTLACAGGHEELVQLLLARGADIGMEFEHRDKKGFTPLILAATAGHANVVEMLLNHGADIEAQSERTKDTPLSLACSGGRFEVVEILLARSANKEHRNVSDYTPLSLAASGGYVNIIKLLLNHGAEINSRTGSKLGISPLMLAAMNGHTTAVKLLLDMGSDINAQIETNRNTALTLACFQGRHEVVSLLVERKANVEHRAKTGLTPLMEAASGGYIEVGRVLLDKGADVNAPPVPSSRDTALTIAADKGHIRFVELLLKSGAQVDVKNKKGNSPMWLAANGGHLDVLQLLATSDADIDSQDNRKVSCLMAAFRKGHMKVVKWMVKNVTQFPSDQEMTRCISTFNDEELLGRCEQCLDMIRVAKDRQAVEANKHANILLAELDKEKKSEESKKAAAARRREKKRQKKKVKSDKKDVGEENVKNSSKSTLRDFARVMNLESSSSSSDVNTAAGTVIPNHTRNLKLTEGLSPKSHAHATTMPTEAPSHVPPSRSVKPPSTGIPFGPPSASNANTIAPATSASSALAAVTTARTTTEEPPPCIAHSRAVRERIMQLQSGLPEAAIANYLGGSKRPASGVAAPEKPVRERGSGRLRLDKEARRERKSMTEVKSSSSASRSGVTIKVGILPDRGGSSDKVVPPITSRQQAVKERSSATNAPATSATPLVTPMASSANAPTITTKKTNTYSLPSFSSAPVAAATTTAPFVSSTATNTNSSGSTETRRSNQQHRSEQQHHYLFSGGATATAITEEQQPIGGNVGSSSVTYAASAASSSTSGGSSRNAGKGGNHKKNDSVSILSTARSPPSLSNSLKAPVVATSSPKRGGSKRDEAGWKEVVRKTGSLSVRSKKVLVPANAISRVIGRGGCNINTIRELSGAIIEVEKQKGAGDRAIVIRGSAESTKHAHQLITQMVKDPDRELGDLVPAKAAAANSKSTSVIKLASYLQGGATSQVAAAAVDKATKATVMSNFLKTSMTGLHPSGVISNMAFPSSHPPFSAQLRQPAASAAVRPGGITMSPAFSSQAPTWPPFPVSVALTTSGGKKGSGTNSANAATAEGGGNASPTVPLATGGFDPTTPTKSLAARQLFPPDKKNVLSNALTTSGNKTTLSYTTAVLGSGKAVSSGNEATAVKADTRPAVAVPSAAFPSTKSGGGVKSADGANVRNQEKTSSTMPAPAEGQSISSSPSGSIFVASTATSPAAATSASLLPNVSSSTSGSQTQATTTSVIQQQRNTTPPYRGTPPPPPQQPPPLATTQVYSPFENYFGKGSDHNVWGKDKKNFASVAAGKSTTSLINSSPVEDEPSCPQVVDASKAPGYRGNVTSSANSSLASPGSLCVGAVPNSGPISPSGRPGMPSSAPSTPPIGPIAPPPGSSVRKASPPMVSSDPCVMSTSAPVASNCFSPASLSSMGSNPSVAIQYSMAAPHMAPIAPPSHGGHRMDMTMAGIDLSASYGPPRLTQQQHSPSQNYLQQQQQMLHHQHQQQLQQQQQHQQQLSNASSYQQQNSGGGNSSSIHGSNLNPNAPDFSSSRSGMMSNSNPNQQHQNNMSQQQQQQMHMNRLSESQAYQHHQQHAQHQAVGFSGPGAPNMATMVSSAPPSVGTNNSGGVSQMSAAGATATSQAVVAAANLRLSYQQASQHGGVGPHVNEYPPHMTRGNVNVNKLMAESESQQRLMQRFLQQQQQQSQPGSLGPVGHSTHTIKQMAQLQALMNAQRSGNPNHHQIISGPSKDDNVHISPVSSPHPGNSSPMPLSSMPEHAMRTIGEDRKMLPRPIGTERAHRKVPGYNNMNDYGWQGSYGAPSVSNEQMPDERLSSVQPNYAPHFVDGFGGMIENSHTHEPNYQPLAPGSHPSGMNSSYPPYMNGLNQHVMMTPQMYMNQQQQQPHVAGAAPGDIWRANNSGGMKMNMNMVEVGGGPNDVGGPPMSMGGMAPGQQAMMGPGSGGPGHPQQPGSEPKTWNTWSHTQM